jgi:Trypsin-co-occurring domain 2
LTEDTADGGWVGLPDAIESLRRDLTAAWWDGRNSRVKFRVEPVELTVQVGVTRTGKGSAGVKWHILTLGGERSKETATTQTLKLQLTPVLFDEHGNRIAEKEQLISGRDDYEGAADELDHESE